MPGPEHSLDRVRRFNKRILNPLILHVAGSPHSPFSVVCHVGRRSGKCYRTPVIVMVRPEGYVFALTYGASMDWYRNVAAAGWCYLRWQGKDYRLESPVTIPTEEGLRAFPFPFWLILRAIGCKNFLQMRQSKEPFPC
jgi:deazaflavin-dependent oxidoreductase (nitroreductase family)